MSHQELVDRAVAWLKGTQKCSLVFAEKGSLGECPDAIGYKNRSSILVECKSSRGDFRADAKKKFRQAGGMGRYRYYLTSPGLVAPEEVPDGWGLLYAGERIKVIVKPALFPDVCLSEVDYLRKRYSLQVDLWGLGSRQQQHA